MLNMPRMHCRRHSSQMDRKENDCWHCRIEELEAEQARLVKSCTEFQNIDADEWQRIAAEWFGKSRRLEKENDELEAKLDDYGDDLAQLRAKFDQALIEIRNLREENGRLWEVDAENAALKPDADMMRRIRASRVRATGESKIGLQCACEFEDDEPIMTCDYHAALQAENERLREALAWYADESNHRCRPQPYGVRQHVLKWTNATTDAGMRAREALEKIDG